jgi:hypothetical protein
MLLDADAGANSTAYPNIIVVVIVFALVEGDVGAGRPLNRALRHRTKIAAYFELTKD